MPWVDNTLIIVEGPQDAAVVQVLLCDQGFEAQKFYQNIPEYWQRLIPRKFPHGVTGDIMEPHPVPLFLKHPQTAWACVVKAKGYPNLPQTVVDTLGALDRLPDALGIAVDADRRGGQGTRTDLVNRLLRLLPESAQTVFGSLGDTIVERRSEHRRGLYVFPDNHSEGTLEKLILEGGQLNYPNLLRHAEKYIREMPEDILPDSVELKEFRRLPDDKMVIHAMTTVLKPSLAIQNSIRDNMWLKGGSLTRPLVAGFLKFLKDLMEQ